MEQPRRNPPIPAGANRRPPRSAARSLADSSFSSSGLLAVEAAGDWLPGAFFLCVLGALAPSAGLCDSNGTGPAVVLSLLRGTVG